MRVPSAILVATDFSAQAEAALELAVELAAKLDATVHLLTAVRLPVLGGPLGAVVTEPLLDDIFHGAQRDLDELARTRAGRCTFAATAVETGDPREVILDAARRLNADLIVMGTHGRRGLERLAVGSVAESVARASPCPVLLFREPHHARDGAEGAQ